MSDSGPPPGPWVKGDHGTHSVVSITVDICLDASGRVFSAHRLQEPLDHATVMRWSGGGQEQVAFGLLVEAARREAILGLLVVASQKPELLTKLKAAPPQEQEVFLATLADAVQKQMGTTTARIAGSVAKEALLAVLA